MTRESFARAVSARDLGEHPYIAPVDHLHAIATTSNLGRALNRLRGEDMSVLPVVVALVAGRLARAGKGRATRRIPRDMAHWIARQALHEWLFPLCRTCHGARELITGDIRHTCQTCAGIGIHRYTHSERMDVIGSDSHHHGKHLPAALSQAHHIISTAYSASQRQAHHYLQGDE